MTHDRCAECKDINPACAWSKGIYPGVLLLYMQELAVNRVLREDEWNNLPSGLLDQVDGRSEHHVPNHLR